MDQFETFLQLHHSPHPLLLGNIWDAGSAKLLEENGFKAIATSSAAVANTLGYDDGESMPFDLLFDIVKRIKQHISLPLSVDLEKGYSDNVQGIIQNMERLHDIGVAGINIEDSLPGAVATLQPAELFEKTIDMIVNHLAQQNRKLFINVRTDAFLLQFPDALAETTRRISLYENAGANGIFVPFIKEEHDILHIVAATSLPVNVLSVPGLPGFAKLASLGVKRISLGSSLYRSVNRDLVKKLAEIESLQSVSILF